MKQPPLDIELLLAPLDARQPAGVFDEEDETFQAIDHEMVKLGGLHEAAMDWAYVEESACSYLARQCKHFRIAGHLITARLRECSWQGWADASGLLAGMVEHYWDSGHPKPGPTGYPHKRRLVGLLVERMMAALPSLTADDAAGPQQQRARAALDQLQACALPAQLEVPLLTRLETSFQRRLEECRVEEARPAAGATPRPASGSVIDAAYFKEEAPLKLGDEREAKRSLLAVADFINQQDAYDPTGYLLRRFALWAHLNAAPPSRREQRTELMGVPRDVAEGYQEALAANKLSPQLLQRVERSVAGSPYWIRGSFIAAAVAQQLEMAEVASSIRLASERFVARIPGLRNLQFADGRPFVDGETLGWLSGADEEGGGAAVARQEFGELRAGLLACLDRGGVEALLRQLETLQGEATDLRDQCHTMSIAADLLRAREFSWLAGKLYRAAHELMLKAVVQDWEPALFKHLARHGSDAAAPGGAGTKL
ncbi:type VI secretion system protein TssA [Azoarcus indigens]|uniref:Type VI secretion system protein VasJ n=1 Tax=Azoarcus indigens TaxID=29545 RepID=A0A4R6DRY4_9RHOO|nr:type VI secretion system protein TssA [Azoarcus indigens]TDN47259.1 type VI secretion system protein VasJ [Azoarcus indigens]